MKQSVRRIGLVAGREFLAAVMNKGFVIGLLLMPAIIALLVVVFPRLMNRNVPPVRGEVAVIDPTGQVCRRAARRRSRPMRLRARRRDSATARVAERSSGRARCGHEHAGDGARGRCAAATDDSRASGERRSAAREAVADRARCRRWTASSRAHRRAARRSRGRRQAAHKYGVYELFVPAEHRRPHRDRAVRRRQGVARGRADSARTT